MVARIPIPIMKSFQFRSKFHVAVFVALLALGAYAILNKNVHERGSHRAASTRGYAQ